LIRASAGTGKTYQLSGQFIDRLRTSPPERVLATTFTRPAAAEILERVLLRLAQAALDSAKRTELALQLQEVYPEPLDEAECLALLADLTRNLHRVRIGTLDSFFIQMAQCFSLDLGLPPGWRIMDAVEESQVTTRAIERLLHTEDHGDLLPLLHLLAKDDASRTVTGLLRSAIRGFYDVYRASPASAWSKVPEPTPLPADVVKQTIEALEAQPLPNDKRFETARRKDLDLIHDGDWTKLLTEGMAGKVAAGESKYYGKPIPGAVIAAYQTLLEQARAIILGQLASRTSVTYELLDRFHAQLRQIKDEEQGLTFADVTRALADGWNRGHLRQIDFRLDSAIEHLLLDEFQDTSVPQWQALEPLAQRVTESETTSLFCVGDQKQAIYG